MDDCISLAKIRIILNAVVVTVGPNERSSVDSIDSSNGKSEVVHRKIAFHELVLKIFQGIVLAGPLERLSIQLSLQMEESLAVTSKSTTFRKASEGCNSQMRENGLQR